ncbi:hypothetical protein B7P43_G12842, partial [Cryptotermes secundus]
VTKAWLALRLRVEETPNKFQNSVNFDASKNPVVKSKLLSHRNIHKFTWTSPYGKTLNQIDHILIERRRHLSILNVRLCRTADCDTDHFLVVRGFKERLIVSKGATHRIHMEKLNLKKLNKEEDNEQYRVEISNRFAALENLETEVDINKVLEPWFDDGYSKFLDQRKQAKLQWLQDPSELNGDNLNNIRRETSRYFGDKKKEYQKDPIYDLATNSKNKNIRDL